MNIEDVRRFLLSLPHAVEMMPFDDSILIYVVEGKWFAVLCLDRPELMAVKCDPDRAVALRDKYDEITPAWHFNKKHWNDVVFKSLPDKIVKREIIHSYILVIKKNVKPKDVREEILASAEEFVSRLGDFKLGENEVEEIYL